MQQEEVLVIGGGITGLTVAIELERMGKWGLVVDQSPFLGGYGASLSCKATDRCVKCNDCLVEEAFRQFQECERFRYMTHTRVMDITKQNGSYVAELSTGPCFIDWDRCTNCGECYEACKRHRTEAIAKAPSINIHPFYGIVQSKCTCAENGSEPMCASVCPEDAVRILKEPIRTTVAAKGIVLATGYQAYEPPLDNRYGYGHIPNVITTLQADRMLREKGGLVRPSDGGSPERLAFVQCVGSRDPHIGREYCSRVCCGYSLRMALRLVHILPQVDITVFYMDIQNFGKDFDTYYGQVSSKVRLIRSLPGDFYEGASGKVKVNYFCPQEGRNLTEDFDMVLLTVGLSPRKDAATLAHKLGIGVNEDGFLSATDSAARNGVVVSGTARGPMDVSECIADAKRAALEVKSYLDSE